MKRYKQKLRDVWLQMPEFRAWLRRDPEDSYRANCRFCKCGVNTKISDLRAHALTKKHMRKNNAVQGQVRRTDSSNDDDLDHDVDHSPDYTPKPKPVRREKLNAQHDRNNFKVSPIKIENRSSNGPDYESIIEGLALYEPEQVLFSSGSTTQSDHQLDSSIPALNVDEDMITNAVTVAVRNLKDSSQIFGDFVADRLRQLSEKTSEYTKDRIMQVILETSALDRTDNGN